ncbi:MAG: twin-arginine translocase TatA/TatE family subunit [Acidobacteriota bacterium]
MLILGPKRIPEAAKSLGQGFRNFRGSMGGGDDDEADKPELGEKKNEE